MPRGAVHRHGPARRSRAQNLAEPGVQIPERPALAYAHSVWWIRRDYPSRDSGHIHCRYRESVELDVRRDAGTLGILARRGDRARVAIEALNAARSGAGHDCARVVD